MARDIYVAPPATPSAAYKFYCPGFTQSAADGKGQIDDLSGQRSPIFLQSGLTYAQAMATTGWVTALSSRAATQPNGTGFQRLNSMSLWNMAAGQSMAFALSFKTSSNNLPSVNAQILGYSPATNFAGFHLEARSSDGKLSGWVSDGANSVLTGGIGSNVCDGQEHLLAGVADGNAKKLYLSIDGGRQYNGISIAAVTGNTSNASASHCIGNTGSPGGSGTFDSGATPTLSALLWRNHHCLVFLGNTVSASQILDYFETPGALFRPVPTNFLT